MVKNIAILALLASIAIAAPTSPFLSSVSAKTNQGKSVISLSTGFTPKAALALQACSSGLQASLVSDDDKAALSMWIKGAGKTVFDASTCGDVLTWCSAKGPTTIKMTTAISMDLGMLSDVTVSVAGGLLPFVNGLVSESLGSSCSCSTISTIQRAALTTFLSLSTLTMDANIAGILHLCSKGGIAEALTPAAKNALTVWLSSPSCSLAADLKKGVLAWLGVGGVGLTVGSGSPGVAAQIPSVVLATPLQVTLGSFINGADFTGLAPDIKAGLSSCAFGGTVGALSGEVVASLTGFLASPSCTLDTATKNGVQLWLGGLMGAGTQNGTAQDAFGYMSLGLTIGKKLNMTGALVASAQAPLLSFCTSGAGAALDTSILTPLTACAKGEVVTLLTEIETAALSAWIASASCSLPADLKGAVLMWLSFGITGVPGVAAGVGKDAGFGLALGSSIISEISSLLHTVTTLSSTCKGALGVAIAAKPASACSIAGRAELAAFLLSAEAKSLAADVTAALFGWLAGSGKSCGCST